MTTATPPDRRRRRRWIIIAVVGAIFVAVIASLIWLAVRAVLLTDELSTLSPLVGELQTAIEIGDTEASAALLVQVEEHSGNADALTGDPVWRLAEFVPAAGPNMQAVRLASHAVHDISHSALDLMAVLDSGEADSGDGPIDIDSVELIATPLADAANAIVAADAAFARVEPDALIPPVDDAFERLSGAISDLAPPASAVAGIAPALPEMMGADGESNILVLVQNNAELRTGGGITGTLALLRALDGDFELADVVDSSRFQPVPESIVALPEGTESLYGEVVGTFVQNTTMTSDFAFTAELAQAWWAQHSDVQPDTIISIDPLVIGSLAAMTGPLPLADGQELSESNAVEQLLIQPYLTLDREEQTAFQRDLIGRIVDTLFATGHSPLAWAEALAEPVSEGRISVWNSDPVSQEALANSALGGPAARHDSAGDETFAVYFNDATNGKMDPFLEVALTAGVAQCRSDGVADAAIRVELTNTAPGDAGDRLPWWVTGGGLTGVTPGDIATRVTVAGPAEALPAGVTLEGSRALSTDAVEAGHPSAVASATVPPGETRTLEFRFTLDDADDVGLVHTPLVREPSITFEPASCP